MAALTLATLGSEAGLFSAAESRHREPTLFGVTDGKAVGTYLEHKFQDWLVQRGYQFERGNSATGIDFPSLQVDMKVTSAGQPQSSCPFRSARQKVYGLGYGLVVFVYDETDDPGSNTSQLRICNTVLVSADRTADYQLTRGLLELLDREGNLEDVMAFLADRHLPIDEVGLNALADEIIRTPPTQGFLTISNALQWRLQYGRAIEQAGHVDGLQAPYQGNQA